LQRIHSSCVLLILTFTAVATPAFAVDFVREVRPIFEKHCYECHGAEKQKNDYRLDIKAVALKNIVAGKSAESPLFRFVSGLEKETPMPPKSKLSTAELETLSGAGSTKALSGPTAWMLRSWRTRRIGGLSSLLQGVMASSHHTSRIKAVTRWVLLTHSSTRSSPRTA
jgi:hypothetical protein